MDVTMVKVHIAIDKR